MPTPRIREFTVLKKNYVTPNMLRVTLGGHNMNTLPNDHEGGYVKLVFPQGEGRLMRTYTIRHQSEQEFDIDFVIHKSDEEQATGPACTWALNCQTGDSINIGGPGPKKLVSDDSDWVLVVGDMTALPAISINLENLPESTKGYAIIEVMSDKDIQPLNKPNNVELHWIINAHPGHDSTLLLNKIKSLPWLDGSVAVWAASEFSSMKTLRQFFKNEKEIDRKQMYISSYWKSGISEDEHKIVKSNDADKEA
ncbi:siderophore-interacting protein [Marinomonas balearica]|uniref:NADPH-dependent ferric siderophore reductase n=1 Tax=Marinomonas balearica TaxID=491947 RepID=A0A4V3CH03_9GAMM|nr:siderophore-interacting protein [Marinomonas balearica]TDO99722.1 NADPH-dependent ferric siderophore reductase [Marinomonas balearica]